MERWTQGMGASEISVHLAECCSEDPLCSAVTHRGQGQNLHKPGEGEDAVLPGKSSSVLPLHLCQSNDKAQPGHPRGRDLAVTASPELRWLSRITPLNIKSVLQPARHVK